jgi:hypothetical protein
MVFGVVECVAAHSTTHFCSEAAVGQRCAGKDETNEGELTTLDL